VQILHCIVLYCIEHWLQTCPATELQRRQILGITAPLLDTLTTDPLQGRFFCDTGRHTKQQQQPARLSRFHLPGTHQVLRYVAETCSSHRFRPNCTAPLNPINVHARHTHTSSSNFADF